MYSEKFHINFIWKARILEELLLSLEFFNFLQPKAVHRQPFHSLVHPARGAFDTCAFNYRDLAFNVHLAFPSFYHLEKGTDASWQSSGQMVPNSIYLILLFFFMKLKQNLFSKRSHQNMTGGKKQKQMSWLSKNENSMDFTLKQAKTVIERDR